jgi:photosystem II stability/assembly factor-like uncharacterized protein
MLRYIQTLLVLLLGLSRVALSGDRGGTLPGGVLPAASLKSFAARSIGPATMGGRVSAIALDPLDMYTFYVGLGTGGVMKTLNNGATFDAVFEKEAVAAIGAIAVAPENSRHVWAGTGEANDRNSSSWGDGVYRSTDGGGTWLNMGLKECKTIARIAIHPKDTNRVYVAAMGDLWSYNAERGLYMTTNGGSSWKRILAGPEGYAERVGCCDVILDPSGPDTLYAALYARRRTPWSFDAGPGCTEGNDAGGIFKSTDGGESWTKLQNGLPGMTGRIGIDICRKDPGIVYAVVQSDDGGSSSIDDVHSKKGGIFRSEDRGGSWKRMSPLDPRPFYFSQIRVDPRDEKRVYVLGFMLHVSDDAGKTWQEDFFKSVHSDCHDLVVDPRNSSRVLLGTDGGIYQSFAKGKSWVFLDKMAAGEFYRITLDMSTPYRIAGGLQDNENWVGPEMTRSKEGILNTDWHAIGGGDGFYCVFDPKDRDIVYAESQGGEVHRTNMRNGEIKGLKPEPPEGQPSFRFHWNSPLIASLHDTGAMYLAGNRLFKLSDHGEHWKAISPDLSTLDPHRILAAGSGAENYGVVYALAESPVARGLLWAGTDDGKLWMTTDEGEHWSDMTSRLPRPLEGQWLGMIEAGQYDPDVAYIAVAAYRTGNYAPLAYRTSDRGRTWKSIAGNLPPNGPVKVIREAGPNLLFAGTEFSLFLSLDGGDHWSKFGEMPTVAVDDIRIHPRDLDLVIATHGRSLYIVDDISPLMEFSRSKGDSAVRLFPPRGGEGYFLEGGWERSSGSAVFRGSNPPEGAILNYYIKEFTGDGVKISITTASGRPVANLSGPGTPGFSRIVWDLRPTADLLNAYGGEGRKFVQPGEYTVTLTYGKKKDVQKLRVTIAPGIETR